MKSEESQEQEFAERTIIEVGTVVSLRSDTGSIGAVIQILPGKPESRYIVLINGKKMTCYGSQLIIDTGENNQIENIHSLSALQAQLTSLQLMQPSLSNLYSLHAARVNYVPYQFRPVIKFIHSDQPRLLIADEVGVGKTIEAGLILRELQARQEIRNICIIAPKQLITERKWMMEMKRFDEDFTHLDGPLLRHCISETDLEGEWPDKYARCIIPFSLFDERLLYGNERKKGRDQIGLLDLNPAPRFDLIIVDEAHALRNPARYLHQGVNFLMENAEAAIFLSATPIQLHNDDLFVLLNMLRPDIIFDKQTFYHMSEPNPYIHMAVNSARSADEKWAIDAKTALEHAGDTVWGQAVLRNNPDYKRLCAVLDRNVTNGYIPSSDERLMFIREVEELNPFASIINRTRRRDIGNFTTRKAETVIVEFTEEQRMLHDDLLEVQEHILYHIHGDRPLKFLLSTLRRQAASCLFGLAPLIETILQRRMSELDWDESSDVDWNEDLVGENTYQTLQDEIGSVINRAKELNPLDDPKRDSLLKIAIDKQSLPNKKILLFSSFRHTLRYLLPHLHNAGIRAGLIQGDVPDEERVRLRDRFSLESNHPDAIDILLSSEIGCEGLDYQFCDTILNYDLPWNPQKIEQRIGRCDRYGQQSETVVIYNLITPGTVDYEIFDRCLSRIGIFQQALGGSEEILGNLTHELHSIMDNLSLTAEERETQLKQLTDNQIRLLQEQRLLEEQQSELFGIILPPKQIEHEISKASSPWLTPLSLLNLIKQYLSIFIGGDDHIQGGNVDGTGVRSLRLSQDARTRLLDSYRKLSRNNPGVLGREWEKWLKGSEQRLEITFDAQVAVKHRNINFIMPIHPLAQQAAIYFESKRNIPSRTIFNVSQTDINNLQEDFFLSLGMYPFVVYQWLKRGVREDSQLQIICPNDDIIEHFSSIIVKSHPETESSIDFPDDTVFDELDYIHHSLWQTALNQHCEYTSQVASYRQETLRATFTQRISTLKDKIDRSNDVRIQRMHHSQITRAQADYTNRMAEINSFTLRADILAEIVARGVIIVQ